MRGTIFIVAWVAIVVTAIAIAVVRFDEYGVWALIAAGLGTAMLVVLAADRLKAARGRRYGAAARIGDWMTGVLIAGVILLLGFTIVTHIRTIGVAGLVALGLFLVVFVNIFRDYLRHMKKKRRDSAGPDGPRDTTPDRGAE